MVLEFFLRTPEPGFLFFAWYGPGFFSSHDHVFKNKIKRFIIHV